MKRFSLFVTIITIFTVFLFSSCLKKDFDNPPDTTGYDPMLPVNMSIAQLKAKFLAVPDAQRIDSDWTIYGVVTADDRSGNFYKQISIEDSTGGIAVLIDGTSLYTKYPIGRKVYIKLKGLYFGYYAKLPQIGGIPDNTGSLSNVPATSADNFIVRANFPNPVPVHQFSGLSQLKNVANQLAAGMIGRLVQIDSVEFAASDTGKTYAQSPAISSGTSVIVEDCAGNKITLRTSGYASFQSLKLAKGKGSITALYTVFNTTPQLVIRDTNDVKFYGERCGGGGQLITIDSLRKMYPGSGNYTLPAAWITAVVISDADSGNVAGSNYVVEDNSYKGIILYISGGNYKLGDSLMIDASGGVLQLYSGAMELSGLSTSAITKVGSGRTIAPATISISTLLANFTLYESTLVRIADAYIPSGGSYSGNKSMMDGTGTITLYTSASASFSGRPVWTGNRNVTAIVTPFNATKELKLRNPTIDVN